jgi:hypothetical protein
VAWLVERTPAASRQHERRRQSNAVSSATVSANGQSKTTSATGVANVTISGSAGNHVSVTITHPGCRTLKTSVTL